MKQILLTYATKTGTTKEIAEVIGEVLRKNGLALEIMPIKEVKEMTSYSGVIIGAPINGMHWLPEAVKFVEDNQSILVKMPKAYFAVTYIFFQGSSFWKRIIKKSLNKLQVKTSPLMVAFFGGRTSAALPGLMRLLFGIKKDAPLDVTDWNQVRQWSEELATRFKQSN